MAALTTQLLVSAGTAPTFVAAAASDTVEVGNGKDTFVVYKNTDANIKTATIVVLGNTAYGEPNPDPAIPIPITTGEKWIPIRKEFDAADGTGRATINITGTGGVTGLTVAVVRHS